MKTGLDEKTVVITGAAAGIGAATARAFAAGNLRLALLDRDQPVWRCRPKNSPIGPACTQ